MMLGLFGEVLAAAKADLQPDALRRRREQASRIERAGLRQADRELWQQHFREPLPPRAQLPAPPPAVDAGWRYVCHQGAICG